MTPTISAPNSVPRIEPRPPNSEMPPITTAVMAWRLKSVVDRRGRDRAVAADRDPGGEAGDQARQRVDRDQHALDADAGKLGRVGIVAHGIDVAAEGGVVEHVPEHDIEQHHRDHAERDDRAADLEADAEDVEPAAWPPSTSASRIVSLAE